VTTVPTNEAPRRNDSHSSAVEAIYAAAHWLLTRDQVADAAKLFRVLLKVAPEDERAWLGLGQCHERIAQPFVALELYGAGIVVARDSRSRSVRCWLARARVLYELGHDPENALDCADDAATRAEDDELIDLVKRERRRLT
jgi:tetratricopeptide (TPR) repeat protein